MSGVYISTGAFRTRDIHDLFQIATDHSIRHIELSAGLTHSPDTVELVRRKARQGFCFLLHNYFPAPVKDFVLNLASSDATVIHQSIEMCKEAIDLAEELGIPFYSLHCGFTFNADGRNLGNASQMNLPRIPIEEAKRIFVGNLSAVCRYAANRHVKIAIENNVLAEFASKEQGAYLGVTPKDLLEILDMADQPNLGVLLDLAHAKVSDNFLGFGLQRMVDMVKHHIIAVHISENDGRHDQNLPIGGQSPLLQYVEQLRGNDIVLEAYNLAPDQIKEQKALLERRIGVG